MNITPLGHRIIVKRLDPEDTLASGIVIPDVALEKPDQGKVLAVGPGRTVGDKIVPLDVKVGDTIMFGKYAGTNIKHEGEELIVLLEDDVMAVLEG